MCKTTKLSVFGELYRDFISRIEPNGTVAIIPALYDNNSLQFAMLSVLSKILGVHMRMPVHGQELMIGEKQGVNCKNAAGH